MSHFPVDHSRDIPIQPSRHGLEIGVRAARHAGDSNPLVPNQQQPSPSGMSRTTMLVVGGVVLYGLIALAASRKSR